MATLSAYRIRERETNPARPDWLATGNGGFIMDTTQKGMITLGAALLAGTAGIVLPAAAAPGPVVQPAVAAAAAAVPAQRGAERAKSAKPLVMLVCREVRRGQRGEAARSADLACVTRWAGF